MRDRIKSSLKVPPMPSDKLVDDLVEEAGRRHAYGALITAARVAWSKYLNEKYGTKGGAWETPLEDEITRLEGESRDLRVIIKSAIEIHDAGGDAVDLLRAAQRAAEDSPDAK